MIALLQVVPFSRADFRPVRDEELLIFSPFSLKLDQLLDVCIPHWNKCLLNMYRLVASIHRSIISEKSFTILHNC